MLQWQPYALPGILCGLAGIAMALLVLRSAAQAQNRRLANLLVLMATVSGVGFGVRLLADGPQLAYAAATITFGFAPFMPFAYASFLATVDSPWARPMRSRVVRGVLFALGVVPLLGLLVAPNTFAPSVLPYSNLDGWSWQFAPNATRIYWLLVAQVLAAVVTLYAIAVAISAARADAPPVKKRQARAYATAFIANDTLLFTFLALTTVAETSGGDPWLYGTTAGRILFFSLAPTGLILLSVLLAYGILQTQLFGIDLRVKVGVRRSFIVAPFALAFFVLAETLEGILPFPGYLAGIAGAGLVALGLQPLRRLADRAADRILPGVEDTEAYRERRALELYRAAVVDARRDGIVTRSERQVLNGLGRNLGLTAPQMARLEAGLD